MKNQGKKQFRLLSVVLAAVLLLSGLPFVPAQAAPSAYTENFEGLTGAPADWTGMNYYTVAEDPADATNHALMMNYDGAANANQSAKLNLWASEVKTAQLEYRIYTKGETTVYPLTMMFPGGGRLVDLALLTNGKLKINGTDDVFAQLSLNAWHTIKLVADAEAKTWEMWVDGESVATGTTFVSDKATTVNGLHIKTLKGAATGVYYDDIRLLPYVEVEEESEEGIYYRENFDSVTLTDGTAALPTGWEGTGLDKHIVCADPKDANNQVMQMNSTEASSRMYVQIKPDAFTDPAVTQAVLEYKIYTTGESTVYPLTLLINRTDNNIRVFDLALKGNGDLYLNGKSSNVYKKLSTNTWHDIKLVADQVKKVCYLWIDGEYITSITTYKGDILGLHIGTVGDSTASGVYYDDICVRAYVAAESMTLSHTALELQAGQSQKLEATFAPQDASLNAATFASDNEAVATVDSQGNVTAIAAGTANITVTPVQSGLAAQTVAVTVTAVPTAPTALYEEDFEDTAANALPADLEATSAVAEGSYMTAVMVDPADSENMVLALRKDVSSGKIAIATKADTFAATKKLVLRYDMKLTGAGVFYPLTAYKTDEVVRLVVNSGKLQYQHNVDGSNKNLTICELSYNEWHEIELVVDAEANQWYIYVDGVYRPTEYNTLRSAVSTTRIHSRTTGSDATAAVYYDNISVTPYVAGESVSLESNALELAVGYSTQLQLNFQPENTSVRSASFVSSDPEVATVDANGKITGLKEGTVTITVTPHLSNLPAMEATVVVKYIEATGVQLPMETLALRLGDVAALTATVIPAGASDTHITFSSGNSKVVTVDKNGSLAAIGEGTAVITAALTANPEIFATVTVTVTQPEPNQYLYVAPNGKDVATGTPADPLSLRGALDVVALLNDDMNGDMTVILTDGYYYLDAPLAMTEAHGGTNGYRVIWQAAPGANPVIGSAYTVSGSWVKDEATGIWSVSVPEGLNSRQLYVDNVRAVRARSQAGLTGSAFAFDGETNIGYTSKDTYLLDYANIKDLELVFKVEWTQSRIGVAAIKDNGDGTVLLTLDQPGWSFVTNKGGTSATAAGPVWIENALELLDEPGEWYLDTENNKLYYMPRPWEDMASVSVTLPTIDGEMITVHGSDYETLVKNIHFVGITFADTTWLRPGTEYGHADAQNNYLREQAKNLDYLPPAAVSVERANGIWFRNCTFTRLGINALQLLDGVQDSFIIGNRFVDISGSAINVGSPEYLTENPSVTGNAMMRNNDILNNYIHNIGEDFGSAAAISVGFAADMDMNHNEIFDAPYSGWHIGYGWGSRFANNTKNMILEHNFVHDYMNDGIYDGGGIYVIGNTSGDGYNIARYNYFRNQMNLTGALYADQGTTWFRFQENVVDLSETPIWHNGHPARVIAANGSTENVHFENTYSTTAKYVINENIGSKPVNLTVTDLVVDPEGRWEGTNAQNIMAQAGLEAEYAHLRRGQAERAKVNAPAAGLELAVAETWQLQLQLTDGKGNAVSGGDLKVVCETLDPTVATVTADGLVTAVSQGITTLRVWVISNNVLDVLEVELVVGDSLEAVVLKNVEDGEIIVPINAETKLQAQILTELGRLLDADTVSFVVENSAVAAISQDGTVQPLGIGSSKLTVTATVNGKSVTTEFTLTILPEQEYPACDGADLFDKSQEDKWIGTGANTWELVDGTSITTQIKGYMTFTGNSFDEELLAFKLKIDTNTGTADWPALVLRVQSSDDYISKGPDGYFISLGRNGIEFSRFDGVVRHVFYGDYAENTSKVDISDKRGGLLQNTAWTYDENGVAEHVVRVGAIAEADGVRILMLVDGVEVINYLDTEAKGAVPAGGFFGIIGRQETFTLTKLNDVAQIGNTGYADLATAFAAARPGEVVKLIQDVELSELILTDGAFLDLNGHELTVGYVVAFADSQVIDSVGGGLLKSKNVRLAANNPMMPVWVEADGGYRFFTMKDSQLYYTQSATGFVFIAKPVLGKAANAPYMALANNGLSVKARMSWKSAGGNDVEQFFVLKGEDVQSIYSDKNQIIQLTVNGAGSYIGRLSTTMVIQSETGVIWAGVPLLYTGN